MFREFNDLAAIIDEARIIITEQSGDSFNFMRQATHLRFSTPDNIKISLSGH